MLKKLITALTFMLLGCHRPTPEELASADYGPYPFDYEDTIKSFMARKSLDPDATTYRFLNEPHQFWDGSLA